MRTASSGQQQTEQGFLTEVGGTSSARSDFYNQSGTDPRLQIEGVGTSSPGYILQSWVVNHNSATVTPHLVIGKSRGSSNGAVTIVQSGDSLGHFDWHGADGTDMVPAASIDCQVDGTPGANDMPGRLVFLTTADGASSPTERMRITSNGFSKHKGGGANYYDSGTTNYHEFTSNQTGTVVLQVVAKTAGFASNVIDTVVETTTNNTSYTYFSGANFQGPRAAIYGNGSYGSQPNSYGGLSDQKLKENVSLSLSQWNDIKNIEVVNFNFIGEDSRYIGVIAQQVEQVSPGLTEEVPDRDDDGNDLGTVTKSVKYSVLYMKAVKALQEAMERIETLEAKVAALETQ